MAAVRAGERKRLDDIDVADDGLTDDVDVPDDGPDVREDTVPATDVDSNVPSKRKGDHGLAPPKKKKAPVDLRERNRLQSMFAGASGKVSKHAEEDDMLEQLLVDMEQPSASPAPAQPRARPSAGRGALASPSARPWADSSASTRLSSHRTVSASPPARPQHHTPPLAPLAEQTAYEEPSFHSPPDDHVPEAAHDEAPERELSFGVAVGEPAPAGDAAAEADDGSSAPNRMFAARAPAPDDAGPNTGWQTGGAHDDGRDDDAQPQLDDEDNGGAADMETDAPADQDSGSALSFFFLDAHYEPAQVGTVYLVGKVRQAGGWASACVAVKNIKLCLFFVPKDFVFHDPDGELARLEEEAAADASKKGALMRYLHGRCSDLKGEIRGRLARHCSQMSIVPVVRTYAFDDKRIPTGRQWVLKVRCDAAPASIPADTAGKHFTAVLGTGQSPLEALMIKRRVMGPSWLSLRQATPVEGQMQVSWCKVEYSVPGPKSVASATGSEANQPPPPLVVAAINLKTVPDAGEKANEIVTASVVYSTAFRVDAPTDTARWQQGRDIRHFSVLRKLDAHAWPLGLQNLVKAHNDRLRKKDEPDVLTAQATERALLACLMARLQALDPDVIVGHNIGNWDLLVLLQRMQLHKVPAWSCLGRFKRQRAPNLSGGGNVYGGGASQGVLTCLAGRLLVDTYTCARELLKEVEYSLATLAGKLLRQQRTELQPRQVRNMCDGAQSFMRLVGHGETDAWLAMGLMIYLSVVPLTMQLSNFSGFLWSRTLQGQRAQRIEMLLLHEFHKRKFLLPDKPERKRDGKDGKGKAKGKAAAGGAATAAGDDAAAAGDDAPEDAAGDEPATPAPKSKGPQYAGGLVLEPKKGLYSKFVLLLDFNSLYPSIIQEYNICFTTVQRPEGDGIPALPQNSAKGLAPLPLVIQNLVQRRRAVKSLMKTCKDPLKLRQLDIRQQAIKLTANSMYGCLGFGASRFYAKPLASLITAQGREILQATVDLVQSSLGLDVIYGDTDSIMVATGSTDMAHVFQLGQQIKKLVNKHYQLLEIDLDGVFKTMLLLKKKKYAAIKLEPSLAQQGVFNEVMEQKGLDIVRRDWCQLSRDVGQYCLEQILSGRDAEDVTEALHEHLRTVRAQVTAGQIPLEKFVITKQLTKRPDDYPDAKNQAHVQVALRMRAAGMQEGTQPGDVVQYVICAAVDPTDGDGDKPAAAPAKSLAERAYHPQEVLQNAAIQIDVAYYLAHQLHPVVSRLCATMDTTNEGRIAECLGLDPSKFRHISAPSHNDFSDEAMMGGGLLLDDDDRFASLPALKLRSPKGHEFAFPSVATLAEAGASQQLAWCPPQSITDSADHLTPAQLANQAVLAARAIVKQYYEGALCSDDDMLPCNTRDVSLAALHPKVGACAAGTSPLDPDCSGVMAPVLSESAAYLKLSHLARQLDVARMLQRMAAGARAAAEPRVSLLQAQLSAALRGVQRYVTAVTYHWVRVSDLFGKLTFA